MTAMTDAITPLEPTPFQKIIARPALHPPLSSIRRWSRRSSEPASKRPGSPRPPTTSSPGASSSSTTRAQGSAGRGGLLWHLFRVRSSPPRPRSSWSCWPGPAAPPSGWARRSKAFPTIFSTWASPGSTSSSRPRSSVWRRAGWAGSTIARSARCWTIPGTFKLVAMMPIGYAEKRPTREPPRKTLEEIVAFNRVPLD